MARVSAVNIHMEEGDRVAASCYPAGPYHPAFISLVIGPATFFLLGSGHESAVQARILAQRIGTELLRVAGAADAMTDAQAERDETLKPIPEKEIPF